MVKTVEEENLELFRRIYDTLFELGVPAHVDGHGFLISAINLAVSDPSYLRSVTRRLYPAVAKARSSTPPRVERSIRNAIEIAASRCEIGIFNAYFGAAVASSKGKPTNSEFIAIAAQKIRFEMLSAAQAAERF